jgi:uncharacterized protein YycO
MWRTWSAYSHVAVEISEGEMIDAWKGGVRSIRHPFVGHDAATAIEAFSISNLTARQEVSVAEALRAELGRPYDYRGVLRFISRRDPAEDNRRWFCSELAFDALDRFGCHLLRRVPAWRVSPGMLVTSPFLLLDERLGTAADFAVAGKAAFLREGLCA